MGGAGAIGAFAYGVAGIGLEPVQWSPVRATSTSPRPSGSSAGWPASTPRPGPTDILVIADAAADPVLVAADLVSQAEHDELAAALLVTDSQSSPMRWNHAWASSTASTTQAALRAGRVRSADQQSAIVLVDDLGQAAAFSNAYGPEHLEIQTDQPDAVLASIENAGAIFLGTTRR